MALRHGSPSMTQVTAQIVRISPERAERDIQRLADLLIDAVEAGASVGFLPPLSKASALVYWREVITAMQQGTRVLLVALEHDRVQGAVQLALETRLNGDHRAEVIKLLVHRRSRRRGLAKALIAEMESVAITFGRTLLLLDTEKGSEAEHLYHSLGYVRFGEVPNYARGADSQLLTTVFFYRRLEGDPPKIRRALL